MTPENIDNLIAAGIIVGIAFAFAWVLRGAFANLADVEVSRSHEGYQPLEITHSCGCVYCDLEVEHSPEVCGLLRALRRMGMIPTLPSRARWCSRMGGASRRRW